MRHWVSIILFWVIFRDLSKLPTTRRYFSLDRVIPALTVMSYYYGILTLVRDVLAVTYQQVL